MANGIIILPISEPEQDARPLTAEERAAAVRSLCAQVQQTGDHISAAAAQQVQQISPERLAALADQLDQLAQRVQAAADQSDDEPPRTELDTIEAEAAALLAEYAKYPEILPLLEMRQGTPMPLDRVTRQIFERGAGSYRITQSAARSDIIALLEIGATAETVQQLEKLTAYDKRLLLAVGGLCENNRLQFTFAQLWAAMGGAGRMNARQRDQIKQSLRKLACTRIVGQVQRKKDRTNVNFDFPLVMYEYADGLYKGQLVDIIEIAKKPRWLEIAEARQQITAVPFDIFADGLKLTEKSIALSDYMLAQIAHMKREKEFSRHMRLEKLATEAGAKIADHKARREFCEKVEKKLAHFAATGFIAGFTRYAQGYKIEP